MKQDLNGQPAFSNLRLTLEEGDEIIASPQALIAMDQHIDCRLDRNGSFLSAFFKKFFAKSYFSTAIYTNYSKLTGTLQLKGLRPGDVKPVKLEGKQGFYLNPSALICTTPGIKTHLNFSGLASLLSGQGLCRLYVNGAGFIWFGASGQLSTQDVKGKCIVDARKIIAFSPSLRMSVIDMGKAIKNLTKTETTMVQMVGTGRIYLQTGTL